MPLEKIMSNHVIPSIILCKKDLLSLMGLWIQLNHVKWFEEGANERIKILYTPYRRFTRGHNSYTDDKCFPRMDIQTKRFGSKYPDVPLDVRFTGYLPTRDVIANMYNMERLLGNRATFYRYDDTLGDYLEDLLRAYPSSFFETDRPFLNAVKRLINDPAYVRGVLPETHYEYNVFCGALGDTMSIHSIDKLMRIRYKKDMDELYRHGVSARRFMATVLDRKNV